MSTEKFGFRFGFFIAAGFWGLSVMLVQAVNPDPVHGYILMGAFAYSFTRFLGELA